MSTYKFCDIDYPHDQHEWAEPYGLESVNVSYRYCLGVKPTQGVLTAMAELERYRRWLAASERALHDQAVLARRTMREANLE